MPLLLCPWFLYSILSSLGTNPLPKGHINRALTVAFGQIGSCLGQPKLSIEVGSHFLVQIWHISIMGAPPQPLLMSLDLKGMVLETKDSCKPSGSLWRKVLEPKVKRRLQRRRQRILMKRRAHLPDSRRPTSGIQRRVRTLKKLVPNGDSMGLDGLFRETADYILSLQMRVEVMQIMVKVLSDSDKWAISLVKADIIFSFFFFFSYHSFFPVEFNVISQKLVLEAQKYVFMLSKF